MIDFKDEYNKYLERVNHAVNNGDIERKELKILTEDEFTAEFLGDER